jgi:outer membrane protein assembly factor BamB
MELSAFDGRTIKKDEEFRPKGTPLHEVGCCVWTVKSGTSTTIELVDLNSRKIIATREEPAGTLVTSLDPETLAALTPEGKLRILNARTGEEIGEPLTVDAESAASINAWSDLDRWYVTVSKQIANLPQLRDAQPYSGYRMRFVDGSMYAINRNQPRIVWQRQMNKEGFSLGQSTASPILVVLWKQPSEENRNAGEGVLKVVDKRTGDLLFEKKGTEILPYFLLNPDSQLGILELKLSYATLRFHYESDIAEPGKAETERNGQK